MLYLVCLLKTFKLSKHLIPMTKFSRSRDFFSRFFFDVHRAGKFLVKFFGRIADAICFFRRNRPYRALNTVPTTVHG